MWKEIEVEGKKYHVMEEKVLGGFICKENTLTAKTEVEMIEKIKARRAKKKGEKEMKKNQEKKVEKKSVQKSDKKIEKKAPAKVEKQEKKPAQKSSKPKRKDMMAAAVIEFLRKGGKTMKEIQEHILKIDAFKTLSPVTVYTFVMDGKNPKYSAFPAPLLKDKKTGIYTLPASLLKTA